MPLPALDFYDLNPTEALLTKIGATRTISAARALPSGHYALRILTKSGELRRYPIHTKTDTALSLATFVRAAKGLSLGPEAVLKTAAHLEVAARSFGLEVPPLVKTAAERFRERAGGLPTGNAICERDFLFSPLEKRALLAKRGSKGVAAGPEWFLDPSEMRFPIYSPGLIKKALSWFDEHVQDIRPAVRRELSRKLASAAFRLGIPIPSDNPVRLYAGPGDALTRDRALSQRKVARENTPEDLTKLAKIAAEKDQETAIGLLEAFDTEKGLAPLWDRPLLDPWMAFGGMGKASEYAYGDEERRVTGTQIVRFCRSESVEKLRKVLGGDVVDGLKDDPISVFRSLPRPDKSIIVSLMRS